MATQQKKPSVSRSSSKPRTASAPAPKHKTAAAPRSGSANSRTNNARSRKAAAEKAAAEQAALEEAQARENARPFRRELSAVGCYLLAIFSVMGFFHPEALFIEWYSNAVKWFIGYGFYVMPLALIYCGHILLFHRGRPVQARITCTLLIPVAISAIFHGFMAEDVPFALSAIRTLMMTGQDATSGGLVGGIVGQLGATLFTDLGSAILLLLAIGLLLLGACDRTIFDIIDWVQARPLYIPEDEPEQELVEEQFARQRRENATLHERSRRQQRAAIDVPMEMDVPAPGENREEERKSRNPFRVGKKTSFFDCQPGVPAPDEVLRQEEREAVRSRRARPAEPAPVAEQRESPVPVSGMVPGSVPQPVEPAPEMMQPQVTRKEAQQAAAEVSRDIAENLNQVSEEPYHYPPLSLLNEGPDEIGGEAMAELNANKMRLDETLHSFGIDSNITHVTRGPSVTRYELELDQGVRLNKLTNLADDIALALGASGVRIAPIPDRISTVGIEVPNKLVTPVNIYNVLDTNSFTSSKSKVSFAVGKDIGGNAIVGNIAKMPHLLIAGTTGSGKSVCTNSLIISLLYKATPDEVRLIMVDPKMVELGIYNGIPHLLIPVVTDPKKAAGALQWAVCEMMKRYRAFAEEGVRDLASYNDKMLKKGEKKMPQVVVIIDELADLMLVAAKEVEESICRVAQMGRASGMHLIIATQRPSADVITGLMKANIPSRIAFAVASGLESRIILDTTGAEKLVGKGDMLYFPLGAGKPTRVQGCLITDEEVADVVEFVKTQGTVQYDENVMQEIEDNVKKQDKGSHGVGGSGPEGGDNDYDELINDAAEVVVETGQASVSMLQRRLKLGYARAARLVDQLEEKGIVGPFEGSKPRQLMITKEQWQEMKYRNGVTTQSDSMPPVQDAPPFDLEDEGEARSM